MNSLKITVFFILLVLSNSSLAFNPYSKPITVVIPFSAGGGVDQTFRHFEKYAREKHNLTLIPVYKSGANGQIGTNVIAKLPGDGYSISFSTMASVATYKANNPKSDIQIITGIKIGVMALITNSRSEIKDFKSLYNVNIKKTFAYGAPAQELFIKQLFFRSNNNINGDMIPYRGGGPVIQSIIGNHVLLGVVPLQMVKNQIDNGSIRLLAVSGRNLIEGHENVPTMLSIFPNWTNKEGMLVILPNNSSSKAVKFWSAILKEYLNDSTVRKDFIDENSEILPFGSEYAEIIINNLLESIK